MKTQEEYALEISWSIKFNGPLYERTKQSIRLCFGIPPSPRRGIGPALRAARPSRGTWSSPVASRAPATSTSETWFGR